MSDGKRSIYIAGPMTGYPAFNRPAFTDAEQRLLRAGWCPVNPIDLAEQHGTLEEIAADPKLLRRVTDEELNVVSRCGAIYLLRGWARSTGARRELETALHWGLEVYCEPDEPPETPETEAWRRGTAGCWCEDCDVQGSCRAEKCGIWPFPKSVDACRREYERLTAKKEVAE